MGLVFIASTADLISRRRGLTAEKAVEVLLYWFIVVIVGVSGVVGFVENAFLAEQITQNDNENQATGIGMQYQKEIARELAFADLGFGIMGILARKVRGSFWLATIAGYSVFSAGFACSCIFLGAAKEVPVSIMSAPSPEIYARLFAALAMTGLWTALWLIRLRDKTRRTI